LKTFKQKFVFVFSTVFVLLLVITLGLVVSKYRFQAAGTCPSIISTSGSIGSIPAECEGRDVVISGSSTVVDAGAVTILGDSKRYFKSLTIQNGATLTHLPLSYLFSDIATDRWTIQGQGIYKKVDIETSGDITLESGGNINVDSAGYPGGEIGLPDRQDGFGPAGSSGVVVPYNQGATGGGGNSGSGGKGYYSSGGIWVGTGGIGDSTTIINESSFLPGSGAGSIKTPGGGRTCSIGGGRVHLKARHASNISQDSFISADGMNGNPILTNMSCGGGGGGTVWLEAPIYSSFSSVEAHANGSKVPTSLTSGNYYSGQVPTNGDGFVINPMTTKFNISADGGNGAFNALNSIGGPGGGGKIYIVDLPPPPDSRKVNVKVRWQENGQPKVLEMDTILGDIK
jgi:hypothetical protein